MTITVTITDARARAAVDNALAARAAVHPLPATAKAVVIGEATLPYECAAVFRVRSDRSLAIDIDPAQSDLPGLDVLHEMGHYVDWALLNPPDEMSSGSLRPELDEWFDAVASSAAVGEMFRILNAPQTLQVTLADGTVVDVVEDPSHATYSLAAPEVFARSYAQYVAVRSGNPRLVAELVQALRNHYPEQWRDADFEGIALALDQLLGGNP